MTDSKDGDGAAYLAHWSYLSLCAPRRDLLFSNRKLFLRTLQSIYFILKHGIHLH
jgi:hypothetical protein